MDQMLMVFTRRAPHAPTRAFGSLFRFDIPRLAPSGPGFRLAILAGFVVLVSFGMSPPLAAQSAARGPAAKDPSAAKTLSQPPRSDATDAPVTRTEPQERALRFARVQADAGPASAQGQQWRVYDLRPYVERMRGAANPLDEVVAWILRETGTDRWFGEVPGMISVEEGQLRVYHVPQVHQVVAEVVDRYANPANAQYSVSANLMTVESVNWRAFAAPLLTPVSVRTPGVEAWVLSRENAAVLLDYLRQRVDYRAHTSSAIQIRHGQSHTIERWQPRTYPQTLQPTPSVFPGYQIHSGQISEGYALKISPLVEHEGPAGVSGNDRWVQAVVQVHMQQIEKLASLWLDVPQVPGQPDRVEIKVPQVSSWRVSERFRWPRDQVLLISRGMVGMGGLQPEASKGFRLLGGGPARVDALLMLECRAPGGVTSQGPAALQATRLNYHDRY